MARRRNSCNPSAYTVMWVVVMFDLPVSGKEEMRRATRFRNSLLEMGFSRKQFSVYMRHCTGMEQADAMARQVKNCLVENGKVTVLFITDRQYGMARNYFGKTVAKNENAALGKMQQLYLF